MRINRSRVRNIELYIHPDLRNKFVRVISSFDEVTPDRLKRIGLSEPLSEGESYLAPPIGRTSRYNSEGQWTVHRDQPKVPRYIRTIYWTWKQWVGRETEEREESRDIIRPCYPRDLVPPPSEEIFGFSIGGSINASTESISLPLEIDRLKHQVNLMLELFGTCEIVGADGSSAYPATTQRRWVFLPPGPYSKSVVGDAIAPLLARLSRGDAIILKERQDFLESLDPQEVAQGVGGFSDYLAYVLPQFGRVVLESLRRDNAIYVFKGKWERFSRYTKRDILDSELHDARIVHTTGWPTRLTEALNKP